MPVRGRRVLTEEELRFLVDDSPDIAFAASAAGDIFWFSKQWYRYVSGRTAIQARDNMVLINIPVPQTGL